MYDSVPDEVTLVLTSCDRTGMIEASPATGYVCIESILGCVVCGHKLPLAV